MWGTLVPLLSMHLGSEYFHMVVFGNDGRIRFDFLNSPEASDAYAQDYAALDTAVARHIRGPDRVAASHLDMLSSEELRQCPVQNELCPRFGVEHRLFVKSGVGNDLTYASGTIRTPRQGEFDRDTYRKAELLHPHLERALRFHIALDEARALAASLGDALDTLTTGIVLLRADATVLLANRAARAILDRRDGLRLVHGRLHAATSATQARLERVIGESLGRSGPATGGGIAVERPVGRPLVLRVLPLRQSTSLVMARAASVILIQDAGRVPLLSPTTLSAIGLTPSEGKLAAALLAGQSLDEFANASGLQLSTVRSTLKGVFEKTETHRQAELVAILSRLGGTV